MTAHSINGTSRHSRQTNREELFYPSDQTRLAKQIKTYFLADGLPGFTLPAMFFSVGDVFFTDFSFEVFLSNLPLLPFTSIFAPFSEPHQAVIFVLGILRNSWIEVPTISTPLNIFCLTSVYIYSSEISKATRTAHHD